MRLEKHLNWSRHNNSVLSVVSNVMCASPRMYEASGIDAMLYLKRNGGEKLTIAQKVTRKTQEDERDRACDGRIVTRKELEGTEDRSKTAGIGDY